MTSHHPLSSITGESPRAAVFHGPDRGWELADIMPAAEQDEAVVQVEACTLCSSDVHTVTGRRASPVPSVLGHEAIGRIIALPTGWTLSDITGSPVSVGDRIVWGVAAHCGECLFCRDGIPQKCVKLVKYGHGLHRLGALPKGGLSSVAGLVRGTPVVVLGEALDARLACLAACAGATVAGAFRFAGGLEGRHVAVFGGGVLGCIACAMAREQGAELVCCVEPDETRQARARRFGATQVFDPFQPGFADSLSIHARAGAGFDVSLEMTGANAAFETGMRSLRVGGMMVLVGAVYPAGQVPVSQEDIVRRMLTIRGLHNYAPDDLAAAVRFLNDCPRRDPSLWAELFGPEFPLADVAPAFAWAAEHPGVRAVIRP